MREHPISDDLWLVSDTVIVVGVLTSVIVVIVIARRLSSAGHSAVHRFGVYGAIILVGTCVSGAAGEWTSWWLSRSVNHADVNRWIDGGARVIEGDPDAFTGAIEVRFPPGSSDGRSFARLPRRSFQLDFVGLTAAGFVLGLLVSGVTVAIQAVGFPRRATSAGEPTSRVEAE